MKLNNNCSVFLYWIASFLAMTLQVVVIARNEAIQKSQSIKVLQKSSLRDPKEKMLFSNTLKWTSLQNSSLVGTKQSSIQYLYEKDIYQSYPQ